MRGWGHGRYATRAVTPGGGHPAYPFTNWPTQFHDPDVGYAWYVLGGSMVTQINVPDGNEFVANTLSDWIDAVLADHADEVAQAGGLLAVHDWRLLCSYSSRARTTWYERMKQRPKNYLRRAVVVVGDTPLLKMAVAGARLMATLSLVGDVELAHDIDKVLAQYPLRRPAAR